MGYYLNSINPYENFHDMVQDTYFTDKTLLIQELMTFFGKRNRYLCIMRPRRFGKTVMANMIGAFFGKAADSSALFAPLKISSSFKNTAEYQKHLNKHNVIYIDFSEVPRDCTCYSQYINRFHDGMNQDLANAYPDLHISVNDAAWDILTEIFKQTG